MLKIGFPLSLFGVCVAAASLVSGAHVLEETADVPTVAIVAQPPMDSIKAQWPDTKMYFAASYVKWLESAGFRVTWILPSWSDTTIDFVFDRVDAIFFTGGSGNIYSGRFADVSRRLVQKVWAANDALASSKAFWGTCLGFEAFIKYTASNETAFPVPVKGTAGVNMSLLINPVCTDGRAGEDGCHLFTPTTPPSILSAFTDRQHPVAFNHHINSIVTDSFTTDPALTRRLRLVSNSVIQSPSAGPDEGTVIVTAIEGFDPERYPVYGTQFHPEKPAFEIGAHEVYRNLDHSSRSTFANNYLAERFMAGAQKVAEVRTRAGHLRWPAVRVGTNTTHSSVGVIPQWIAHVNPTYTNDVVAFEQCYLFA